MTEWYSSDIAINGTTLHYFRTGGDHPPVILAHGLTDSALCWRPVVRRLAPSYDVVFYDARGHGQSLAPETGYSPAERLEDLVTLIDRLGFDTVGMVGHSLGAEAAVWLLAYHPDRVRCAVLEDPPWRQDWAEVSAPERANMQEAWHQGLLDRKSRSREELVAFCRARSPDWSEEDCQDWAESKLRTDLRALASVGTPRPRWQPLAARIRSPTLLITGDPERGALVTAEVAREAMELCPYLEHVHIAGVGHTIRRDRLAAYFEAVLGFLGRN
jgi:pimeloyl-ACP methyl ester carboxylesterase